MKSEKTFLKEKLNSAENNLFVVDFLIYKSKKYFLFFAF